MLYQLRIYCHLESVFCIPEFCGSWPRLLFNILIYWHQINGKLHFLVDVFSKHLCRRVELSSIGALGERLVDMTVHLLRCALEITSLVDRNSLVVDSLVSSASAPSVVAVIADSSVSSRHRRVAWSCCDSR